MDYQQQHRYMRPPPPPLPSMADPHHQPPPRQPIPPPGPWYPGSGQFQYQPPSQQSPSPAPPHQQWAPPPSHSDHLPTASYATPHPYAPYQAQPVYSQYQPPTLYPHRPPVAPQYHAHSQIPQYFQDGGNVSWGHHQAWEHPAQQNEEDWATKAKAWAAANSGTDNQHSQSQLTPVARPEEQSHYYDQYQYTADPHYTDVLQPGYQQYPPSFAPSHRPPAVHLQESASISSGQSYSVADEHLPYSGRDGNSVGNTNAMFPRPESSPTSSLVHLQEVPYSYSSVTGKEEAGDQNGNFFKSFPLPVDSSQGPHHAPLPAVGRSVSMEQPHYAVGNQSIEAPTDLSDQPLQFSYRFNQNHDPLSLPSYNHTDSIGTIRDVDPVAAVSSNHTWAPPAVPGAVYPQTHSVVQPGQQHDPSIAVPSSVPGHSAPLFGRIPGQSFQPTIPSVGTPFGIGTGSGLHPTTAFPGDVYGLSSVSERPKKASVPNWLREEIIKKTATTVNSASEKPKDETESIEDEAVNTSPGKADQADSRSIDSSKSNEEEEEDDEDYVEAASTPEFNQEIKRILTEVLLKVTDELFDEIATKVVSEDDLIVQVDQNVVAPNHKLLPSAPVVPTNRVYAKVLIPSKSKETETEDDNGKSSSRSPEDVLGLASYASDDDDVDGDDDSPRKLSEDNHEAENGSSQVEVEGHSRVLRNAQDDTSRMVPNGAMIPNIDVVNKSSIDTAGRVLSDFSVESGKSSKTVFGAVEYENKFDAEKRPEKTDASGSNNSVGQKVLKTEPSLENTSAKKSVTHDSLGRETRNKHDKNDKGETRRISGEKDLVKDVDGGKGATDGREDENNRRQDERHVKKERTDDRNGSKERTKDQDSKSWEKSKESDSRKRSVHPDVKEDRKEKERDRRVNAEEDSDKRRERGKEGERSRHKLASESSRHKRRRSSSVGSRGRSSKDNPVISHDNDSSDESSDDIKRKLHSRRRNLSPSPNRSRRRQDSRSPHSKHSQRRHSPYSSLETTRGKRSRSRSPVRRQR